MIYSRRKSPAVAVSLLPIFLLLSMLVGLICCVGASSVQDYSAYILLLSSAAALIVWKFSCKGSWATLFQGLKSSTRQTLPTVPILLLIGTLASTWMLSGVVPTLISYGLEVLNPTMFLATACAVCAVVSVMTGSSWTTIATIGVAFLNIGVIMGYSPAWVAGAIISGAYFGDKVSPLSDTTVLAASSSGVKLFPHIRFMTYTTVPAMSIALLVYIAVGLLSNTASASHALEMDAALRSHFNITPWLLVIPAIVGVLIALRKSTILILSIGSLLGLAAIFLFQPAIVSALGIDGIASGVKMSLQVLLTTTEIATGNEALDSLVSTGGVAGMLPTVWLVLSAMVFGGVMIGTGMLASITEAITSRLGTARNLVTVTVGSGLFLNACTGDQYLSIIIGGNVYSKAYRTAGLEPRLLSRSLEDSISVTSPLIPWNSCGVTQATVLGVATLTYLPCCIFNILSPLMSIVIAWAGWRIRRPQAAIA